MKIILDEEGGVYQPFGEINGRIDPFITEDTEVVLFWYTKGRGTEDVQIIERKTMSASVSNMFSFTLPDEPYSLSGKLISVIWALEIVDAKNNAIDRLEFVVSPTGEEFILDAVQQPESAGKVSRLKEKLNAKSKG